LLGIGLSKILGRLNVLTIIGGDIYDPTKRSSPHRSRILRILNKVILNSADDVIAISSDTKRRAEQYYGIKKEIQVINYGFIPVELKKTNTIEPLERDGKYQLIAVGRLVERKGFAFLIRALSKLPSDIVLHIVGDGPLEAQLKEVADKCELNGRVIFAGYQPREKIYEYLLQAHCFVLPSLHEGLGIVVQEAMYVGLPIVATDNGGQVDLVKDHRNGILVKPEDVDGLAAAIRKFYHNKKFAEAVGMNNTQDIKEWYMSVNAEKYVALFKGLLGEPEHLIVGQKAEVGELDSTPLSPLK
jgi:L-malate glycosyltransferase